MFHKFKLRGQVFEFSPVLINRHYGRHDEGITGSTLKLADIIKTLTRNALSAWPTKGQLQSLFFESEDLDFGRVIFDQIVDHSRTGAKLKPIGFNL
ncbi:hypothetical protein LIER_26082 [Lithospermum erythrorhizon]|uniref:Uncharacterized protein n=1 Tax=Lithospermum erythrorhizon TaxID=34254 RepID=A0AAV3RB44_LITER